MNLMSTSAVRMRLMALRVTQLTLFRELEVGDRRCHCLNHLR